MIRDRASSHDLAVWGSLLGVLVLLVLLRTWIPYDEVFRNRSIVLAGNDPYAWRYYAEELLASDNSPFSLEDLAGLPAGISTHHVLFILSIWAAAVVLGGTAHAVGLVLAWYPVVTTVVTALLLYLLVVRLTADRRLGVLTVLILALTPAHVYRTMVGFGDHDAFHMFWVVVTAAALVWLVTADHVEQPWTDRGYWLAIGGLGIGVTALCFAWRGGPMLLIPIAVFACAVPVSCVRHDRSPIVENWGILVGLGIAAGLSAGLYLGLNLGQPDRGFAPALLLGLVAGVIFVSELLYRLRLSWPVVSGSIVFIIGAWAIGIWNGPDVFTAPLQRFLAYSRKSPGDPEYQLGEGVSLVAGVRIPVLLFGLLLIVALPVMLWLLFELWSTHRPGWIVVSAYAWSFLALSVTKLRFAGVLAVFVAVFGALGTLHLVSWATGSQPPLLFSSHSAITRRKREIDPMKLGQTAGVVVIVVVLVMGLGLAQVPGTMDRITVDDTTYETATWTAEHADEHELTYPDNYVFSAWGTNRVYNYAVNGNSESYSYAKRNYREFLTSSAPEEWYEKLAGRAGYVIVHDTGFEYPNNALQVRLNDRFGSAGDGVEGVAHYRLVYVSDDRTTKVFRLVPGATVVGNATPNSTVQVESNVRVGDTAFRYRRTVQADADGQYNVTVPYPGRYTVGSDVVSVNESNVKNGETINTVDPTESN